MSLPTTLTLCQHPVLLHNLAILRNKQTPTEGFRSALHRVAHILMTEATQTLPVMKTLIDTPLCKAEAQTLSSEIPILITPILRAGLSLCTVAMELLPSASVYHVGLYRDEETLKPVTYYNKLPSTIDYSNARMFLLDPMLATGGSAVAALDLVTKLGVRHEHITFVCLLAAPEGIAHLTAHYPDVRIVTGCVDDCLNDKGFIVPGLGDAGDRMFGTV